MAIKSVNPATGKTVEEFEPLSKDQVEAKLTKAQNAYESWRWVSLEERAKYLIAAADHLKAKVDIYGEVLTKEMGKPIGQARSEVEKCAFNFQHYAESAADYLKPRIIETDASTSYVTFQPLGVILNIMPWNFAFWQALRMAAPIIMAGNTIVLKHASNVPRSALAIEKVFNEAGFPAGVYQTLLIDSSTIEDIINDDRVQGVALTGSEGAGSAVGAEAGKQIKPVILELGGSDPSIVLADADVSFACETASKSRLQNNGQSCIGSKRFIVHEDVYDEFLEELTNIFSSQVLGDPMDEETDLGPVVSEEALDELLDQIKRNQEAGATVHYGGNRVERDGFFLEPTILTGVTEAMPAYKEELFGPVVVVYKFSEEDQAIKIANDTDFGLGASIYTSDTDNGQKLASKVEAGSVFINGLVKSDPRLPFGGIKRSGIGRELSEEGIKAFTNTKTIWVK